MIAYVCNPLIENQDQCFNRDLVNLLVKKVSYVGHEGSSADIYCPREVQIGHLIGSALLPRPQIKVFLAEAIHFRS